jgi:hypothetical protein
MAKLTKEEITNQLRKRVNALHTEATSNRLSFQVGKTSIVGVALGAIGCMAFPPLGIPAAAISAGVWITAMFAESSTTGRISPFPFASTSLHQMAAGMDRMASAAGVSHDEIELTDYLPAESRIEYLLIRFQGARLAALLSQLDESEIESSFAMITQYAINIFGKNGLRLGEALQEAEEFLHDAAVQCGFESAAPINQQIAPQMDPGAQHLNTIDGARYPAALPEYQAPPSVYAPSPNTQIGAIPVQSFSVPSLSIDDDRSPTFDWNRLNTEYDDFPHLLMLGKTGAGKSYLSDRLVRFLSGYTLVIAPKKKPKDFVGLPIVGVPYEYKRICNTIKALEKLMIAREREMNETGNENFTPINVILDDFPVASAGCKDLGLDLTVPLKMLIRNARSSKIRLIILAQGTEVKTLGIEGEGSLRDNITYVYLKGFVEKHAQEIRLDISGIDRPCIIDEQIADTAFLQQFEGRSVKEIDLGDKKQPAPRSVQEVDDYWAAGETVEADEWQSKQEVVAAAAVSQIDRQFELVNQAIAQFPSGKAFYITALQEYFKLDDAAAVQFATLYAFKNKAIVSYDPNLQALVKK